MRARSTLARGMNANIYAMWRMRTVWNRTLSRSAQKGAALDAQLCEIPDCPNTESPCCEVPFTVTRRSLTSLTHSHGAPCPARGCPRAGVARDPPPQAHSHWCTTRIEWHYQPKSGPSTWSCQAVATRGPPSIHSGSLTTMKMQDPMKTPIQNHSVPAMDRCAYAWQASYRVRSSWPCSSIGVLIPRIPNRGGFQSRGSKSVDKSCSGLVCPIQPCKVL